MDAAEMYAPLRIGVVLAWWVLRLRRQHQHQRGGVGGPGVRSATAALPRLLATTLADAARSSAFLASFISLFYYGVCLARTRLGPRIFSSRTISPPDVGLRPLHPRRLRAMRSELPRSPWARQQESGYRVLCAAEGCGGVVSTEV